MTLSHEDCRLLGTYKKLDREKQKVALKFVRLLANDLEPDVTCGQCAYHEEIPGDDKPDEVYCNANDLIRKRDDYCSRGLKGNP